MIKMFCCFLFFTFLVILMAEMLKEEEYTIMVIGKGGNWCSKFVVKGNENYEALLKYLKDDCLIFHKYEKIIDACGNNYSYIK